MECGYGLREEFIISDHKSALIPLESWAYNSPELKANGVDIDVGLFAESLIYYDSVLLNVTTQPHLADFIGWVDAQQSIDDLLALLENGEVSLYDYSFASAAVKTGDTYTMLNLQDEIQAEPGTFQARFIDHATVSEALKPLKQSKRLGLALSERVIEVKANEFGSAISNAEMDFKNPERVALVVH